MPKGVYERKSAQQKTAKKPAAKVKAKAKAKVTVKARTAAKPAIKPVEPPKGKLAAVLTTPAAALATQQAEPQFSADDFRKSIDDMAGPLLKAYARRIGIKQRDVDGLTEDRLRQNCKAMLLESMDD